MAHNTPDVYEVPAQLSVGQIKRRGSYADDNAPKRLRTEGSIDRSPTGEKVRTVSKENDKTYVTKEEFNSCIERMSRIEARLAKIEKMFESLKFAFLGAANHSTPVPLSEISGPTSQRQILAAKSSHGTPTSAVKSTEGVFSEKNSPQVAQLASVAKSAHGAPESNPKSAQRALQSVAKTTPSSVKKIVPGTPASVAKSSQSTPHSTVKASASKSAQGTPLSSTSQASQQTPSSSTAKPAQRIPLSSAAKPGQSTPLSVGKPGQPTPALAAKPAQPTRVSAAKSAQGTPLSSTPQFLQRTPLSTTAKSAQSTPVSSSKFVNRTPHPASKSFYRPSSSATNSVQASTFPSKTVQVSPPYVAKTVQAASTSKSPQGAASSNIAQDVASSAEKSRNKESVHDEITIIQEMGPDIANTVNIQNDMTSTDEATNLVPHENSSNVGINKPRITVIPSNELLAAPPGHPASGRNPHLYTHQRAGPSVTSNIGSCGSSSSTSTRTINSTYQVPCPNVNDPGSSSTSTDVIEIPEEAFRFIRPKQEIYDNPLGSRIEMQTKNQIVAYIDGDCRKKKNHDIYAAVAGGNIGPGYFFPPNSFDSTSRVPMFNHSHVWFTCRVQTFFKPYVSDLKRPSTLNARKMAELVKQQAEVTAASLVFQNLKESCKQKFIMVAYTLPFSMNEINFSIHLFLQVITQ